MAHQVLSMSPNTSTSRVFPSGRAASGKKKNTAAPQLAYRLFGGSQECLGVVQLACGSAAFTIFSPVAVHGST
jgi:hypothetical protein